MSKKLGNMIREARTQKGLTQAALAEQAGISSSEIGKIERGEKEPSRDVLRKMAKPLGVTQKSLLDACTGSGTSSEKKPGKTSSSSKKETGTETLTATEKKLVQLYRKADSNTKKAAMSLLSGEGNAVEILGSLILGKKEVSTMASGLLETLLSGKKE